MKSKLLYILVLMSTIFVGAFFVWQKLYFERAPEMEDVAPVTQDQVTETVVEEKRPVAEEITFTEEQLKSYYAVYSDPFVILIRKALNGYLNGTNEGMEIPEAVIEIHEMESGAQAGLAAFERDYYQSKFVVVALEDALMGGKTVTIIFQEKPDRVFTAWVYKLGDDQYDLRGFWEDREATKYIDEQLKTLGRYIFDKEHSI